MASILQHISAVPCLEEQQGSNEAQCAAMASTWAGCIKAEGHGTRVISARL